MMSKKWLLIPFLFCLFIVSLSAQRQGRGQDNERVRGEGFPQFLWVGGGFNLGFTGSNDISIFQIGISPMAGYKITEQFSVGPRVSLQYSYMRARNFNGTVENKHPLSYGIAAFARHRIFRQIFAHVEYEYSDQAWAGFNGSGSFDVQRFQQDNVYIGGGYSSGFPVAYEILLLYNANQRDYVLGPVQNPISIRFGFTYNF